MNTKEETINELKMSLLNEYIEGNEYLQIKIYEFIKQFD